MVSGMCQYFTGLLKKLKNQEINMPVCVLYHMYRRKSSSEGSKRRRRGSTYELVGVLIHIGAGANVGHYVAHIRDEMYE